MARPKIKIQKTNLDKWLEIIAIACLIILFLYPAINYSSLPEKIPSHFGGNGLPDDYAKKASLWILPIIGLFLYLFLSWIQTIPHLFNYSVKITEENAERQYKISIRLVLIIKVICLSAFAYITWSSVRIALEKADGMGVAFLPILLILIFGTIGYTLYLSAKNS